MKRWIGLLGVLFLFSGTASAQTEYVKCVKTVFKLENLGGFTRWEAAAEVRRCVLNDPDGAEEFNRDPQAFKKLLAWAQGLTVEEYVKRGQERHLAWKKREAAAKAQREAAAKERCLATWMPYNNPNGGYCTGKIRKELCGNIPERFRGTVYQEQIVAACRRGNVQ